MPVPGEFTDLSETPSANSPGGSEPFGPNANLYLQAAFAFIRMIHDGQILPLAPVNFNSQKATNVANGVANSDAVTLGQVNAIWGAPSGTRAVLQQASAPAGWTIDTSTNYADCSARFNSSTGGASGGTSGWSTWNFGGLFSVAGHALTIAELPPHTHGIMSNNVAGSFAGLSYATTGSAQSIPTDTGTALAGQVHGHTYLTPQIKYADCLIAIKS